MAPVIWPCQSPGCTKTVPVEDGPHLAIQLLRLHGVQVHGLSNMDRSPKVTSTKEGKQGYPVLAATSTFLVLLAPLSFLELLSLGERAVVERPGCRV